MRRSNASFIFAAVFLFFARQVAPSLPDWPEGKGLLQTTLGSDGSITVRFVAPEELADPPWDLELLAKSRFSLEKYGDCPYFPVRTIALEVPSKKMSLQIIEKRVRRVADAFAGAAAMPQPDSESDLLISPRNHRLIPVLAFPETPFPTQHVIMDSPVNSGKKIIARLKLYPFAQDEEDGVPTFAGLVVFRLVPMREGLLEERRAGLTATPPDTESGGSRPLIFTVPAEGIYSVPAEEVFAWWGSEPLPLNTLSLKCRGHDVAYHANGDGDELFEAGEAILFYGVGGDNIFTGENAYWLEKGGHAVTMSSLSRPPPGQGSITHCQRDVRFKRNVGMYEAHPPGTGEDHWFWEKITAPQKVDIEIELDNLANSPGFQAVLQMGLQGATASHRTRVALNGELLVEEQWDGLVPKTVQAEFAQKLLQEGTNVVTIEELTEGENPDVIYLDWIDVRYDANMVAEDGQLKVAVPPGVPGIVVSGLESQDVVIFDVTQERAPCLIEGAVTTPVNGHYRVEFGTMADSEKTYIVLSGGAAKLPSSVRQRSPSNWSSPENGADWIVITRSDFLDAAGRLASHRESQGLRTAVADVQDVYDEFNSGITSPEAIRDFMKFAYGNWDPKPTYLLLFGDGHGDYMDWYETHQPNFILPHYSWIPPFGWAPEDDWFGCVDGDDAFAEVTVGRLPVRSQTEAESVVDKVIAYESAAVPQEWQQHVTFCGSAGSTFQAICQSIANGLPLNFESDYLFRDDYPDAGSLKEDIFESLNAGASLFFYVGHGNVERWSESILHTSDVPSLTNAERLPVMCMLTCLTGYFAVPWKECLAEELVRAPNGGAAGCVAPTATGYPSEHVILGQEVVRVLFGGATLGECLRGAKLRSYMRGLRESSLRGFCLIGDPATSPRFVPVTPDLIWFQ
ncbi:MAG: C25 family cysteine peptidase [bacterium]|nr:C25 family cysteine peptidase [bacterium]